MRRKRESYSLTVSDHLRLITLVLIIVGYIVTLTVSPLHAQLADTVWPMFKHDTRNTGQSPYAGPENNNLKWQYALPNGILNASPVIGYDGTIYICNSGVVFAINKDGSLKWRYETHGGGIGDCAPAISLDGTIYVPSHSYSFYALNPDGTLKWTYQSETSFNYSSPSIGADGIVYVGSGNDLLAIKPDGNLFWKYRVGEEARHSPAIAQDGTIYIRGREDYLVALNTDGSEKWRLTLGSRESHTHASPVIGPDGTIYTFGLSEENLWDNVLYAINPDGSIKWKFDDIGFSVGMTPSVDSNGIIYLNGNYFDVVGHCVLYAIRDLHSSGILQWTFEVPGLEGIYCNNSSPAIDANGIIYFGTWGNRLYALNPDGTLKWTFEALNNIDSSPAIGENFTIYFGSWDGYLYAIGPSIILDGDANGDESINVQDVICIINHILGTGTASGSPDCNSDSNVNVQDVICVINKILGG